MSKIIILASLLFCVTFIANAQESITRKILSRFELVGGPSFSRNTGYVREYESRNGNSGGLGYYQQLTKSFSLNLRALYETKGSVAVSRYTLGTATNSNTPVTEKVTSKFTYLTIYLVPTFQLGRNKNIHIGAGGYYSNLRKLYVNSYRTRSDNGDFISQSTDNHKTYFHPDYDAGVTFQVGYAFNVCDKAQVMLQAFSNRGVKDLYNGSIGSQRNNTFGLLLSARVR